MVQARSEFVEGVVVQFCNVGGVDHIRVRFAERALEN